MEKGMIAVPPGGEMCQGIFGETQEKSRLEQAALYCLACHVLPCGARVRYSGRTKV